MATVTLTNQEVESAILALQKLGERQLQTKLSFAFIKSLRKLEAAHKDYSDARTKLLEQGSRKGEDGKPIIIDDEYDLVDKTVTIQEVKELKEIESDFEFKRFPLEMFPPEIELNVLYNIEFLIEEETEGVEAEAEAPVKKTRKAKSE